MIRDFAITICVGLFALLVYCIVTADATPTWVIGAVGGSAWILMVLLTDDATRNLGGDL